MKWNIKKLLMGEDIDENVNPENEFEEYEEEEGYVEDSQQYASSVPARSHGVSVSGGASMEMKVIKPTGFESATEISDLLLSKKTVLLNLEDTNKETARRLIDFLSGVAYAIDGELNRVANSTFVVAPHNVKISDDQFSEDEIN